MDRVPGQTWLLVLAAVVVLAVASAAPFASASEGVVQVVGAERARVAPDPEHLNPYTLAGAGALVITGVLLLLFFYRRRLYILFWIAAWVLLAGSMFVAGRQYSVSLTSYFGYGISQFLGVISGLMFVLSADAYPSQPPSARLWTTSRHYAYVVVLLFLWFALAPLALGPDAVFAPGHVLMAGAIAAAGVAYLILVQHARMLGAIIVGAALLLIAAVHVWTILAIPSADDPATTTALLFMMVPYLVSALGMQLMTFEDMTFELRRTNRRLETAQGKLRRMVITDPLTGCRNRRFFDEIIGRELERRRRYGIPLSLLFVDIDRFKVVNDQLGHEAGDEVLRQVAAFLLGNIREADYVFRWGGDEFLILLSCGEQEARRRGTALRKAFAQAAERTFLPTGVGLSVGCAEVGAAGLDDVMEVVKVADERMYENKRKTRITAAIHASNLEPAGFGPVRG
jgi:diguanylate cyclase (GGDEF)-like protein